MFMIKYVQGTRMYVCMHIYRCIYIEKERQREREPERERTTDIQVACMYVCTHTVLSHGAVLGVRSRATAASTASRLVIKHLNCQSVTLSSVTSAKVHTASSAPAR